jgi:hypothetical protein
VGIIIANKRCFLWQWHLLSKKQSLIKGHFYRQSGLNLRAKNVTSRTFLK